LKFQAVAEKTAKDARGLLYFAAPGIAICHCNIFCLKFQYVDADEFRCREVKFACTKVVEMKNETKDCD